MVSRKTSSSGGTECSSVGYKIPKVDSATGQEPNTTKPVLDSHSAILLDGRFADVTFLVGDRKEKIPAHQLFLKARSSVFEVMFSKRWNQDNSKDVLLEHVHPKTFKKFLKFIYTDALDAAVPEALELLELAHEYQVQLLVTKCEELLGSQVTLDDALPVFQAARLYQSKRLMDRVGDLWAESLSQFQTLPSFSQLDKETLMYILQREDLDMNEVDLFRLALQWGRNQTTDDTYLQENLLDVLPLIRFPTMTLNEFTDAVVPTNLLSPSTITQVFIYFGTGDMAKRRSLAKTLGFSTLRRQPKRSVVYLALYPEDNGSTRYEQFVNLTESLQFHEAQDFEMQAKDVNLGICGFTFNCPTKATIAAASGTATGSTSFKTFKISLKSKDYEDCPRGTFYFCNRFYTELVSFPSVQVEEGTTTEIKFETVIPLKKRRLYSITVEEVVDKKRTDPEGYNAQVFGPDPEELVTVMVNSLVGTRLAVQRNRLQGFWGDNKGYACPQLISRLALQVL